MNYAMIRYILGTILKAEALLMCLPALVSLWYRDGDAAAFLATILAAGGVGLLLSFRKPQNTVIYAREGFVVTSLSWIVMSLVGPLGSYATLSYLSKLVLILDMLLGRLEIFPMLMLFAPSVWAAGRKKR